MMASEAHCQCCGGYAGHGRDPEFCGACIRAGEPPEDWVSPTKRAAVRRARDAGVTERIGCWILRYDDQVRYFSSLYPALAEDWDRAEISVATWEVLRP